MNKYQEALQKIASLIYEASKETLNAEDCEEYFALKELVEKATPKKMRSIRIDSHIVSVCPSCQSVLSSECLYCPECGQKLDYGV